MLGVQLGLGMPAWGNRRPWSPYLTAWNTHCSCPRLHQLPGAVCGAFWWMGLSTPPGPALARQEKQASCEVQKEPSGQSELPELEGEWCPTHPRLSTWCRSRPCGNSTLKSWPMSCIAELQSLDEPQPAVLVLAVTSSFNQRVLALSLALVGHNVYILWVVILSHQLSGCHCPVPFPIAQLSVASSSGKLQGQNSSLGFGNCGPAATHRLGFLS